ncbi:serine/threonine protein kinase [Sphaeroforma arctica JP610]|uniref:Serine/threonine protein kinase n=1 Tax=Sphaeroforma arctica JP610 TaxID=667725 RepID=A0A0L0FGF2_9EUKA|nr:serine/threonine protein kinase [Sphaeroforma arctica JP610]KNC75536.1 serine/threonine protein kinase [Sphaeroforma arctica JP610]|eukprot:XP_014149438.1 serine/threonine protein kinase [Sphaeroforma arctica JP610]
MAASTFMTYFQCFGSMNDSPTLPTAVKYITANNCTSKQITLCEKPISCRSLSLAVDPSKRFTDEVHIQNGSTCVVSSATDIITSHQVALKKARWAYLPQMEREFMIQQTIGAHPNIGGMRNIIKDFNKKEVYLVMELLDGGDLVDLVANTKIGMTSREFICFALQLARGLKHIHDKGVVHRDIKADNVCTSKGDGVMKFVDFGEAALLDEPIRKYKTGTLPYIAPELLDEHRKLSEAQSEVCETDLKACDVWSLGITFYSMLTCRLPFKQAAHGDKNFAMYSTGSGVFGPTKSWIKIEGTLQTLIANMCAVDVAQRWTIEEVEDYLTELSR